MKIKNTAVTKLESNQNLQEKGRDPTGGRISVKLGLQGPATFPLQKSFFFPSSF